MEGSGDLSRGQLDVLWMLCSVHGVQFISLFEFELSVEF